MTIDYGNREETDIECGFFNSSLQNLLVFSLKILKYYQYLFSTRMYQFGEEMSVQIVKPLF